MKPLAKVKIEWSPEFAYVIGLIVTDGNLSTDGRHISFTSKDLDFIELYKKYLGLSNKIGIKSKCGYGRKDRNYYVIQFGDVLFYKFLLSIGLMPKKSKTLGELNIPDKYFYDFLRGCIDGDGTIDSFRHPESKLPQFRIRLVSASKPFLVWVKSMTEKDGIKGYFTVGGGIHVLAYAKRDSTKLVDLLYYSRFPASLERKYSRAKEFLRQQENSRN
ncbi:MAG: LAGLIDADG family homing endonuclease [Patescibacteria group bacterium]